VGREQSIGKKRRGNLFFFFWILKTSFHQTPGDIMKRCGSSLCLMSLSLLPHLPHLPLTPSTPPHGTPAKQLPGFDLTLRAMHGLLSFVDIYKVIVRALHYLCIPDTPLSLSLLLCFPL
jgi:hypothetical protein